MNITHHQLTTEDGQKKAVAKYVLAISMDKVEDIHFAPSAKYVLAAVKNNQYPMTQYLYAVLAHNNNRGYEAYEDLRNIFEKIRPDIFTDGNALFMLLGAPHCGRAILDKICFKTYAKAANKALMASTLWPKYTRLIRAQILKTEADGRLLFNATKAVEGGDFGKIAMMLGILVHYRRDTQLIRDVYKEILKVIHKSPPAKDWEASQAQCIENMLAPVLYETIEGKFSTTVTKPDPDKLTAANIGDPHCSEIEYEADLSYSWDDILDVTDDPYYVDMLMLKAILDYSCSWG